MAAPSLILLLSNIMPLFHVNFRYFVISLHLIFCIYITVDCFWFPSGKLFINSIFGALSVSMLISDCFCFTSLNQKWYRYLKKEDKIDTEINEIDNFDLIIDDFYKKTSEEMISDDESELEDEYDDEDFEVEEEDNDEFPQKSPKVSSNRKTRIISDTENEYAQSLSDTDSPLYPHNQISNKQEHKRNRADEEAPFIFEKSKSKSSFRSLDDNDLNMMSSSSEPKSILRNSNRSKSDNEVETKSEEMDQQHHHSRRKTSLQISRANVNEKTQCYIIKAIPFETEEEKKFYKNEKI